MYTVRSSIVPTTAWRNQHELKSFPFSALYYCDDFTVGIALVSRTMDHFEIFRMQHLK